MKFGILAILMLATTLAFGQSRTPILDSGDSITNGLASTSYVNAAVAPYVKASSGTATNLTISGTLTAPDASSTAPSAIANVGTLDQRYGGGSGWLLSNYGPTKVYLLATNKVGSATRFVGYVTGISTFHDTNSVLLAPYPIPTNNWCLSQWSYMGRATSGAYSAGLVDCEGSDYIFTYWGNSRLGAIAKTFRLYFSGTVTANYNEVCALLPDGPKWVSDQSTKTNFISIRGLVGSLATATGYSSLVCGTLTQSVSYVSNSLAIGDPTHGYLHPTSLGLEKYKCQRSWYFDITFGSY